MNTTIFLDAHWNAGPIDPRIFGGFLEHIGRAVYQGVFDPGNPLSDEQGYRKDVLDALRPMNMPVVRYPGGNYVSNYDWRDGIGPKSNRCSRPDFAWKSVEPNLFGVDEFIAWCRALGTNPFMVVNLGTAGAKEAAELVEYCNLPGGTFWADQRIANGVAAAHGIRLWGLGNEMDGPWQAGHVPADVYALRACQAAQLMKGLDPTIELVAVGSTTPLMPTYMEWDRKVLEDCWDRVDYISAHSYSRNTSNDTPWFLAEGVAIDNMLDDYAAVLRYVGASKKSKKRVYVAFDEWNVWYRKFDHDHAWWQQAPALLEEVYNLEDALVVAQYLNSFIRHANIVKIACIAQICNVIAPILTRNDGMLIQSIYHPFVMYSQHARGLALSPIVETPTYEAGDRGATPIVDISASYDAEKKRVAIFMVNRDVDRKMDVEIAWNGPAIKRVVEVIVLSGSDPKAENSWEHPNSIKPVQGEARINDGTRVKLQLPALSTSVVALELV